MNKPQVTQSGQRKVKAPRGKRGKPNAKTAYRIYSFVEYLNRWRWMKHKLAGRQAWCGVHTGATHAGRHVHSTDGTATPDFDRKVQETWTAATEDERLDALCEALVTQSGPPGVCADKDTDTLCFRQVNTTYPFEADTPTRSNGILDSFDDDEVQQACRKLIEVSDALERAVDCYLDDKEPSPKDWNTLLALSPLMSLRSEESRPPRNGAPAVVAKYAVPRELLAARRWVEIVELLGRAVVTGYREFVERPAKGVRLARCQHPGCGDMFAAASSRERRCGYHRKTTAAGKSGSNKNRYAEHKASWDTTSGNRDARALWLAKRLGKRQSYRPIQAFLSRKFARGVTGVTCSYAVYRKHFSA